MWDLSRPGIETMSPALASGFLAPATPGKSLHFFFSLLCPSVLHWVCCLFVPRQYFSVELHSLGLSGGGLLPPGVFWKLWELTLVVREHGVCYWCLVGRGPEMLGIL